MYNKTIIRFGFCDIQNNQGRGKGYQPKPKAEADNLLSPTKWDSGMCHINKTEVKPDSFRVYKRKTTSATAECPNGLG